MLGNAVGVLGPTGWWTGVSIFAKSKIGGGSEPGNVECGSCVCVCVCVNKCTSDVYIHVCVYI